MRALIALLVTFGFSAWAQSPGGGAWTGYVNGWVPDQPRVARVPYALPYVAPYVTWPYPTEPVMVAPPAWGSGTWRQRHRDEEAATLARAMADQADADRRAREAEALRRAADDAAARELAAQRATQELAAQQLALQQAAQELAAQRLAAQEAALKLAEQKAAEQRAQQLAEQDAAAAKKVAAAPVEKGPDVYRWVDDEGVVHYSTRAPSDARVKAAKVGGR